MNVGSVIPKRNSSLIGYALYTPPTLISWIPVVQREGRGDSEVVERPVRVRRDRRVARRRVEREARQPRVRRHVEDGRGRQDVLPAQVVVLVVGLDPLGLARVLLRVAVGDVAVRAAEQRREAEGIAEARRGRVEPNEGPLRVAVVVEVVGVGCIGEVVGSGGVDRRERRRTSCVPPPIEKPPWYVSNVAKLPMTLPLNGDPRPDFVVMLMTAPIFSPNSAGTLP